ncbi:MAG: response regulator [Gammaproteobacteria bacterium]|nr:response regulator [Gammaproteobacteria bacterium]
MVSTNDAQRVLIVAPAEGDAAALATLLRQHGIGAEICAGAPALRAHLETTGALLLTEEALEGENVTALFAQLGRQPPWSEVPLIILTRAAGRADWLLDLAASAAGSVTLLERPLRAATLLRSVQVALHSRRRQYQVRDLLLAQRERELALRASEERLRLALEGADLGSWDIDLRSGTAVWNARHAELLGYPADAPATPDLWRDRIEPEDRPMVTAAIDRAREERTSLAIEHRLRRADNGELRWLALFGRFHYDPNGVAVRFSGVTRDVTQRKQLESEREGYLAALQEADRRKDTFLATLSHELRNPLAPIRNAAEVLTAPQLEPAQLEWARSVIQRQVAHMAWLLDDLLDLARITRGKLQLRRQACSLRSVVDAAVETTRPFLQKKNQHLALQLGDEIPALDADPLRLAQVLSNLLTNAVKYTEPGGQIELSAQAEPGWLRISVKDNGIGIPAEKLGDLFTMFAQIPSSKRWSEGGLGIGLALAKGLMELHGGTIEARSGGLGQGSEFTVRLPLKAPVAPRRSAVRIKAPAAPPQRRRVLIADDNQDAAESLAMLLAVDGFEVRTAYNGEDALALARGFRPEVALLDIGMPALDGYATAQAMRRQEGEQVCLIALTGWGQEEDKRRAFAAGFSAHLTKPVDPARLRDLLSEVPRRSGPALDARG